MSSPILVWQVSSNPGIALLITNWFALPWIVEAILSYPSLHLNTCSERTHVSRRFIKLADRSFYVARSVLFLTSELTNKHTDFFNKHTDFLKTSTLISYKQAHWFLTNKHTDFFEISTLISIPVLSKCPMRLRENKFTKLIKTYKKYGIIWEFFPTWGGVFPIPKTFVNWPRIFLYAKFILRC